MVFNNSCRNVPVSSNTRIEKRSIHFYPHHHQPDPTPTANRPWLATRRPTSLDGCTGLGRPCANQVLRFAAPCAPSRTGRPPNGAQQEAAAATQTLEMSGRWGFWERGCTKFALESGANVGRTSSVEKSGGVRLSRLNRS